MNTPYMLDCQITENVSDNLEYYFQQKINLNHTSTIKNNSVVKNNSITDISNNILQLIKNLNLIEKK